MSLEVEHIWTSENHSQKGVLKCTCALEVSKDWNDHWCHWCRFVKPVDKQLRAWSIDLSRLEHVDVEGLLSFDYRKHHAFLFPLVHVRSVGSQIAYSEDDNVNAVAPGGTARPSSVKHRKAIEKHRKPSRTILENQGLPRRMQVFRTVCNHAAKPKGSSSCIWMLFVS